MGILLQSKTVSQRRKGIYLGQMGGKRYSVLRNKDMTQKGLGSRHLEKDCLFRNLLRIMQQ